MNEILYYEKSGASLPDEVKAAYEHAVENNFKYYRAVSKSGTYYGYVNGRAVHAAEGQEWFENPEYKEPIEEITANSHVNVGSIGNFNRRAEPITYTGEIMSDSPDYKAMYEVAFAELKAIRIAIATLIKEFKAANKEIKEEK